MRRRFVPRFHTKLLITNFFLRFFQLLSWFDCQDPTKIFLLTFLLSLFIYYKCISIFIWVTQKHALKENWFANIVLLIQLISLYKNSGNVSPFIFLQVTTVPKESTENDPETERIHILLPLIPIATAPVAEVPILALVASVLKARTVLKDLLFLKYAILGPILTLKELLSVPLVLVVIFVSPEL